MSESIPSVAAVQVFSVLLPIMAALRALVEDRHGLVCRAGLHLLEVCPVVAALGARRVSLIHVLPRLSTAEDIVDILAGHELLGCELLLDTIDVGASSTSEGYR